MRGAGIHPMERQVLVELRQPQKPLQRRLTHLHDVAKAHVVLHQRNNLFSVLIREPQPAQDLLRYADTHLHMSIKTDAVSWLLKVTRPNQSYTLSLHDALPP